MKSVAALLALCAVLMASSVTATEECKICTVVFTYIDSRLASNATEQEINAVLEHVCTEVPTAFQAQCRHVIIHYADEALALIKKMSPSQICQQLRLCAATGLKSIKSTESCLICKFVLTLVEHELSSQTTIHDVEAVLDKICTKLPSSVSGECNTLINEFAPIIAKLLVNKMPPAEICAEIKLCSAAKRAALRV